MNSRRYASLALLVIGGLGVLAACSSLRGGPSGNENVPQPAKKTPLPPKYRNPKTGETWSGRGRAPAWLAGRNKDRFLIET